MGRKKKETPSPMFYAQPILNNIPIVDEIKVDLGVEASIGRSYWKFFIHDLVNEFVH